MNSKSFKVICMIMIIFGVIGAFSSVSLLTSGGTGIIAQGTMSLLSDIGLIVAGIIGNIAVKSGETDKISLCRICSYILLAITALGFVIGIIITANTVTDNAVMSSTLIMGLSVIGGIISLILPVLYIFGARKLDK